MTDGVALLLSRAGFGPTAAELASARAAGYAATVNAITTPSGPDPGANSTPIPKLGLDPYSSMPNPTPDQKAAADGVRRQQIDVIMRWWIDRMTAAKHQGFEKLMFFWHGHWATSVEKVMSPQLMLRQHLAFRAATDFTTLAHAMVLDPALVYSLDGHANTKQAPNENLGRELMELFLLGIGHYTEKDVKEAGRALTGWWVNLGAEKCELDPDNRDEGSKTILGMTANFTADSLVDHLLRQEVCPRFLAARLWYRYASSVNPLPKATEQKMVAAFPSPMGMLRVMFEDDAFLRTSGQLVKQPVEWLIGAMRQLGLRIGALADPDRVALFGGVQDLGQVLFSPPSVGGWPSGVAWLTPSSARIRLNVSWKLANLVNARQMSTDELGATLAIDTWSDRTYDALRETKDPRLQLTIGLSSPEYLVT